MPGGPAGPGGARAPSEHGAGGLLHLPGRLECLAGQAAAERKNIGSDTPNELARTLPQAKLAFSAALFSVLLLLIHTSRSI